MKTSKKASGFLGGIFVLLLSKLKYLVVVLKIAKLHTLLSLLLSIGAYAFIYGWKFAIVFVYLLFIHEMGHLIAAKRKGLPTTAAVFIPFMGALIGIKEKPKTIKDDAYIAYMGPLAGLLSILPLYLLYFVTHQGFWMVMIQVGAMLNLFNLIPMMPLDGGHIARMLSKKLLIAGLLGVLAMAIFSPDPILILLLIFGTIHIFTMRKEGKELVELKIWQDEFKMGSLLWEELLHEYSYLEINERQLWLNRKIYEYKQEIAQIKSLFEAAKNWEEQSGFNAKAEAIQGVVQQLESLYDNDSTEQIVQSKFNQISEEVKKQESYEKTSPKERWLTFGAYLLLIVLLSGSMVYSMHMVEMLNIHPF
ncbi:site-2 protease family protein [Heyndrickxia acidicola]|uniref:Site-2 protease family protein n=1 Tax=Heyndrickxia acidicola TaxID=209389 RepID=A0ABU6MKE2_9BACI|nr:site-2 protease family protein [Heyndrickxia acidicola]MED1204995.1 site-2 protease family protein [Heyndrickxia acidicola]